MAKTPDVAVRPDARAGVPDPVLRSIGFLAFFDRFATPPILVALAAGTALTLGQAVGLVAVYSLLYAVGQPIWGLLSDRFGRLTVLRLSLAGAMVGAAASTLFTTYGPLLAARAFTGLMFGALYPTLLTLLGDTRTGIDRARGLSDLQIYSSLGTTLATLGAGALAVFVDWRLVFALPALGCLAILVALRGASSPPRTGGGFALRKAFTGSAVAVYLLAMLEGSVLNGAVTYIVPALQAEGVGIGLAGILGTGYALGVIAGARTMRRLVQRFTRTQLIAGGGAVLVAAFVVSALWASPASFAATATLIGAANAILHSSMQGWATDVAPEARATTVSLFAGSLFLGASLGTFSTAHLAEAGSFAAIFGYGALVSVGLTGAATRGHAAWFRRQA